MRSWSVEISNVGGCQRERAGRLRRDGLATRGGGRRAGYERGAGGRDRESKRSREEKTVHRTDPFVGGESRPTVATPIVRSLSAPAGSSAQRKNASLSQSQLWKRSPPPEGGSPGFERAMSGSNSRSSNSAASRRLRAIIMISELR